MSSEPTQHATEGRCLFCSLGCRMSVEQYAPQRWRPAAGAPGQGSPCARGQMIADLMHHPERIDRPTAHAAGSTTAAAIREIADRWRYRGAAGRLELWLDGNVAIEDLAAAHAFCASLGERAALLVHVPPHDLGAVEGLDAAGRPQAPPDEWAQADAFLVIGDPFRSHPPVAAHLMRWGNQRRETPMVVIDSAAGITGSYTSDHIVCRPGYEYWVVGELLRSAGIGDKTGWLPQVDLCRQVVQDSGVEKDRVHRAAMQLRSAHRPAVVIAPQSGGRAMWRALSAVACQWAKQRGGTATVLTGCANALGVSRFLAHRGVADWATGMSTGARAKPDLLLVVGWDPSSAYPRSCWAPSGRPAGMVVVAAAFNPSQTEWVDMILPLALPSEVAGTYLLADGQPRRITPMMPAPTGTLSVRELMDALAQALGQGASISAEFTAAELTAPSRAPAVTVPAPPAQNGARGLPVVLTADAMQYFDGHATRRSRWARSLGLRPELRLSEHDAYALRVSDSDGVSIHNEHGSTEARVAVVTAPESAGACDANTHEAGRTVGWGAISGGFAEVRQLADWQPGLSDPDGGAGLIHVEVRPLPQAAHEEQRHAHA